MINNSPYNIIEILTNFSILMEDMNFSNELDILKINKFCFRKRKKAYQHMQAIAVSLWRLALQHSFPSEYEIIFGAYLCKKNSHIPMNKQGILDPYFQKVLQSYIEILNTHGDSDFTEVSSHLINALQLSKVNNDAIKLKLALTIRTMYNDIFKKLI